MMDRRSVLQVLALAAAWPALSRAGRAQEVAAEVDVPAPRAGYGAARPWSVDALVEQARALAAAPYEPVPDVPRAWLDLSYDQYKNILFDPRSAIWHDSAEGAGPFEVELFAPGLYFRQGVDIHTVEATQGGPVAREVLFTPELFTLTDQVPAALAADTSPTLGFSGFRLKAPINSTQRREEFLVFQGASYFRATGRDQFYGLSARGLAIGTGGPDGEEFPFFRAFWIEKPAPRAPDITVHALMDSPSVAGAYTFRIAPGDPTVMDVAARLFPRTAIAEVGIAPLTSMFLYDETNRNRFDDFRPAVHDSDGLLVANGAGERLWRKLANPRDLQVSWFVDDSPQGFGLMQRARALDEFADLEAHYERRPSLWVEPRAEWGPGAVVLVEIPADQEIYDNVVAFWRPREPLEPNTRHDYRYRLNWGRDFALADPRMRVEETYLGRAAFDGEADARTVAIDFVPPPGDPNSVAPLPDPRDVVARVSADRARIGNPIVKRNPQTGGLRLAFTFYGSEPSELRAQLLQDQRPVSEVWLYRWTPDA